MPSLKRYLNASPGRPLQDIIVDINQLGSTAKERTGYPTQKPLALLERIIKASSNPGDIVFDPFCGCATTLVAADRLQRSWVGIDISPKAAELVVGQDKKGTRVIPEHYRPRRLPKSHRHERYTAGPNA